MVRLPGKIEPGSVCREMLITLDCLPMILRTAGASEVTDRVLDGRDPTATFADNAPSPHETLYWGYGKARAMRDGYYKLVSPGKDKPFELYDLRSDIGETEDLAAEKPEVVARLTKEYDRWLAEAGKETDE